jgi:protein-tyrosine phosphatase
LKLLETSLTSKVAFKKNSELHIQAVITVARGGFLPHPDSELPNYMYLPADDKHDFNIAGYFEKTYGFIDKQLSRTNVLVHCAAGISRSASIVVAYLMKKLDQGYSEVLPRIKSKRPSVLLRLI